MHSQLYDYQDKAVRRIVNDIGVELGLGTDTYRILLHSPTGSGKTVMIASVIEETNRDATRNGISTAFLWLSPGTGGLDDQSAQSLRRELEGTPDLNVFELDPTWAAGYEEFAPGDVGVVSWEALHSTNKAGEFKNRLTRDGEQRSLFDLLEKTRASGTRVVALIDEAHHAVGSGGSADRLLELIREAAGGLIEIHATATPVAPKNGNDPYQRRERVDRQDVVDAGMVARTIYINEGTEPTEETTAREVVLEAGYERLKLIESALEEVGSQAKPLTLVQLPDGKAGDDARDVVEDFFRNKGATAENRKLAVWLDKEKSPGVDRVEELDSPIRILMFKQAVAKGWDCPRAYVLIRLRSTKSVTFDIQTIGRICRQPERTHYNSEILDNAFIYTDTDKLKLEENVRQGMGSGIEDHPQISKWRKELNTPALPGVLPPPQVRPTLDDELFAEQFEQRAKAADLASKVTWSQIPGTIPRGSLSYTELAAGTPQLDESAEVRKGASETQAAFDAVLRQASRPYQNRTSAEAIRKAVYSFLRRVDPEATHTQMQDAAQATDGFFEVVKQAVDDHKVARPVDDQTVIYKEKYPKELIRTWSPPSQLHYSKDAEAENLPGYAYEPHFKSKRSGPERLFEPELVSLAEDGEVNAWWKNGDRGREYFAVPYRHAGGWHPFYPDYLVMWSDGVLGIYETKAPNDPSHETTEPKAEALAAWINERKPDMLKVEYGICVHYPDHGGWFIHEGIGYVKPPKDSPDVGGGWKKMSRLAEGAN